MNILENVISFLSQNPHASMEDTVQHIHSIIPAAYKGTIGYYYNAWHKKQHPFYSLYKVFMSYKKEQRKALLEDRERFDAFVKLHGSSDTSSDLFYEFIINGAFKGSKLQIGSRLEKKLTQLHYTSNEITIPAYARNIRKIEFANGNIWLFQL